MVFDFFRMKKKPVVEDVQPKEPPKPAAPATFEEALAAQEAGEASQLAQEQAMKEAATPTPTPAPAPAEAVAQPEAVAPVDPEVPGQMDTMKATREDVIAAYKIFLGRVPESMEVVDHRVGQPVAAVLVDFLASKEFLDQAPKAQLVLAVAKKILDERKQAAAADGAATAEQGQPAA